MKVIVISANAFSKTYNNGKTLEAIFSAFETVELAQLFTRPQDSAFTDYEYCNEFYVVSEMDILNRLIRKNKTCGNKLEHCPTNYQSEIYGKFKNSPIKYAELLRDALWGLGLWKTQELDNWILSQNADIVFVVGGGCKYLHSLALYICNKLKRPVATFYTDDYLLHPQFNGLFGKLRKVFMYRHYKRMIKSSSICFAIGDMMCKEYEEYFKKEFYPIMNAVPIEEYIRPDFHQNVRTISYFGGLHLNRWKMICSLGKILPDNWEFNVYTSTELTSEMEFCFKQSNVKYKGCITGADLRNQMLNSQVLLHVESDDPYNRALTRLSVSTKIPEYLMAGRSIIGYGPQEVASMHLLTDNKIGYGIDSSQNTEEIKKQLSKILSNDLALEDMGYKAYRYAIAKFNQKEIANRFREKLESSIATTSL